LNRDIAPHADPNAMVPFTIPAVDLADGTCLQDSLPIAKELEKLHPRPSLHLDSPYLSKLTALIPQAQAPLAPVFAPNVARLLNPSSEEYFRRTREKRFGMELDAFEKSEKGGAAAWAGAEPALKQIAELLKEDSSGPFFMGSTPSYADFMLVGFMKMFDRIGQLDGILKVDQKAFGSVWKASQEWLKRDDH
jgi:glutathione S-transferase